MKFHYICMCIVKRICVYIYIISFIIFWVLWKLRTSFFEVIHIHTYLNYSFFWTFFFLDIKFFPLYDYPTMILLTYCFIFPIWIYFLWIEGLLYGRFWLWFHRQASLWKGFVFSKKQWSFSLLILAKVNDITTALRSEVVVILLLEHITFRCLDIIPQFEIGGHIKRNRV